VKERCTGRRRELPALSFAFASVSVSPPPEGLGRRRYSIPELLRQQAGHILSTTHAHDTFAPSPLLAAAMAFLVPY
jgi:hypothetical protein